MDDMDDMDDLSIRPPHILLSGARAAIGPVERGLIPLYLSWRSDIATLLRLGTPRQHSLESINAWYEETVAAHSRRIAFTIYDLRDKQPVGDAALSYIDHHAGTAEYSILLGERRNEGLGTEATRLVLDYGFNYINLHNIMLVTFSWNVPAIRAYTKAGFKEVGRRREAVITRGHRYDHVIMDAVSTEFSDSAIPRIDDTSR